MATSPLLFIMEGTSAVPPMKIVLREDVIHMVLSETALLKPRLRGPTVAGVDNAPSSLQEMYVRVQGFKVSQMFAKVSIVRATSRENKKTLKTAVGFLHVLVRNVEDVEFVWSAYTVSLQQSSVFFVALGLLDHYKKQTVEQFHKILVAAVVN